MRGPDEAVPPRPGADPGGDVAAAGADCAGLLAVGARRRKRELLATCAERRVAAPLASEQLAQASDPAYRRVHLYGRFDRTHSVLLDNRLRDGQAGVELLQPFHDQASGLWLLVNRGWLPWPDRRGRCSSAPRDTACPAGLGLCGAGQHLPVARRPARGRWPHLLTAVDAAQLWPQLGREGFAHELRLEPGPASYRLDWPVVAMGPEKHLGYAVQWFALAAALVALYLYFGWHNDKENHHGRRHASIRHV
ncbi:SURF1 family protein [Pseudomonas qingdaonensis]|nr:SURF1 family protein [Pseudomonas qingdaonensis]